MNILITGVLHETQSELAKTKQMLTNLKGADKDWKPHDKSMTIGKLASHIAELQSGFRTGLEGNSFDFQTDYKPYEYDTFEELSEILSQEIEEWQATIKSSNEAFWLENFTLKNGDEELVSLPRIAFFRSIVMNHAIHHRGQLAVYMRLLDIPVPGIYGPSADDK